MSQVLCFPSFLFKFAVSLWLHFLTRPGNTRLSLVPGYKASLQYPKTEGGKGLRARVGGTKINHFIFYL